MRTHISRITAALTALLFLAILVPGTAGAAPTDVTVRIEGKTGTIFDRVVETDGGLIRSASDTVDRTCDGTNLDANPTPGPTPTAASVDAMKIIGQDFDAQWYDLYDDYFLTRWGTDTEDNGNGWWWGILVNEEFTPVGGCQFRIQEGDEVLWVFDAFSGRPMLTLEGPTTAVVGEPITVNVGNFEAQAYEGAEVIGLNAAVQPLAAGIVTSTSSDANGDSTVTFSEPGWKRLKAVDIGDGAIPVAVPSRAIDVCVERTAGSGCTGEAPSQIPANVGQAPAVEVPEPEPNCETDPSLCPPPTCETDPSLCPPDPEAGLRIGQVTKPRGIRAGSKGTLSVKVNNPGDAATTGVRVCPKTWARLARSGCATVGQLQPGQTRTVKFTFRARRKVNPGSASVRIIATGEGVTNQVRNLKVRTLTRLR